MVTGIENPADVHAGGDQTTGFAHLETPRGTRRIVNPTPTEQDHVRYANDIPQDCVRNARTSFEEIKH